MNNVEAYYKQNPNSTYVNLTEDDFKPEAKTNKFIVVLQVLFVLVLFIIISPVIIPFLLLRWAICNHPYITTTLVGWLVVLTFGYSIAVYGGK